MSNEFIRESMRHHTADQRAEIDFHRRENDLVIQQQMKRAMTVDNVQSYRAAATDKPLPFDLAKWVAAAESIALIHQEAESYHRFKGMHTYYRTFRTLELMGKLPRGGRALFVGSGMTIDEVTAFYAEPPRDYWLRVAYRPDAESVLRAKITVDVPNNFIDPIMLKDGSAVSFDPRTGIKGLIDTMSLLLDPVTLQHQELGVRGFTDTFQGEPFDTIVINRADPEVFRQFAQKGDKDKRSAIARLTKFLRPNGTVCVTVGSGNNGREGSQRRSFILSGCDDQLKPPHFNVFKQLNHNTLDDQLLFSSQHDILGMLTAKHVLQERTAVVTRGSGPRRIN